MIFLMSSKCCSSQPSLLLLARVCNVWEILQMSDWNHSLCVRCDLVDLSNKEVMSSKSLVQDIAWVSFVWINMVFHLPKPISLSCHDLFESNVLRAIGMDGYVLGPLGNMSTNQIRWFPHEHNVWGFWWKLRKPRTERCFFFILGVPLIF